MLLIVHQKVDARQLGAVAEDLKGYIKLVVDLRRGVLSAGGMKHVDGERLLLQEGSCQEDLWGAGLDLESGQMDFDSMINLRPDQNASREILDQDVRRRVEKLTRQLLQGER